MALAVSHKQYTVILFTLAIASVGIVFDFDVRSKIQHYNSHGVAHYDLPYEIFPPSSHLFRIVLLDSIAKFPKRDAVVLIGNSIIAGVGAKDTLIISSSLNSDFNVINAGLRGEYLSASSALAVIGVDENVKKYPSAFHHIVVAYPPAWLYEMGSYWATGPALTALAKERNLSSYIMPFLPTEKESIKQTIQSIIASNMRCAINRHIAITAIKNLEFYCEIPFGTRVSKPGFIKAYARSIDNQTNEEYKTLSRIMNDNTFVDNELLRNNKINGITEKLEPLERFLLENGIRHKLYFLLLRDAPAAINALPKARRNEYDIGRAAFLKELTARMSHWEILDAPQMGNSMFFDSGHLRDSGQVEIATFIKQEISRH